MVIFHNQLKKALLRVKPPLGIHGGALYARIEIDKLTLGRRSEKANHMVVPDHKVTRGFTKSLEAHRGASFVVGNDEHIRLVERIA